MPILGKLFGFLFLAFVPGFFFSCFILKIKKSYYHLVVFSATFSFIFSPIVTLPAALIVGQATPFVIIGSITVFCLTCVAIGQSTAFNYQPEENISPSKINLLAIGGVLVLIGFILTPYMVRAVKSGMFHYAHTDDLVYLRGIVLELSRQLPPVNPAASFATLNQTWGIWYFYALLHNLTGISIHIILVISCFYLSFILINLINLFVLDLFGNVFTGVLGVLLLFDFTSSLLLWFWDNVIAKYHLAPVYLTKRKMLRAFSYFPYITDKSYYMSPAAIMIILSLYLILKSKAEERKTSFYLACIVLSCFPFFHAGYYLLFLGAISFWLLWEYFKKSLNYRNLWYLITPLPFYVLYVRGYIYPNNPPLPPAFWFAFHPERVVWLAKFGILSVLGILAFKYVNSDEKIKQTVAPLFIFSTSPLFISLFVDNIQLSGAWYIVTSYMPLLLLSVYTITAIRANYSNILYKTLAVAVVLLAAMRVIPEANRHYGIYKQILSLNENNYRVNTTPVVNWIKSNTSPEDLFVVMPDGPSIQVVLGSADRRVVYGYSMHIRSTRKEAQLKSIRDEIKNIFCPPDEKTFQNLCKKYKLSYIYVGEHEDTVLDKCPDRHAWEKGLSLVFQNERAKIYRVE